MLDYKAKYKEIKMKLIESTDMAYRLGYEAGMKDAQSEAAMQQVQQAQEAQMNQMVDENGNPIDQTGAEGQIDGAQVADQISPEQAGELDQYIDELERLVAKGEKPTITDLRKTVNELTNLRKAQKNKEPIKIETISSSQKKLVDNILAKWEKEAKVTSANLEEVIKKDGIKI